ncbi:hypothetical protein [Pseudomonas monteilii]|uniref:Uncharacterized protein n=1 Tax=Pseudomonas monteilii TaxID=76759 RepID=A0A2N1IM96_9PSED|nr:hypothetical protein [Pseudomonas monteilii]PKI19377.1 hypothetical protein CXB65_23090 [Pseudomonas monteilii]RPD91935.1 hypothetical protein EGN69_15875 [Pseudomonas monteilii]
MDEQNKSSKAPLALSDAAAGCIAAILLFAVQKFPDGSDIKALCMYLSPVAAILMNNTLAIFGRFAQFHYRKKVLNSQYKDLSEQYREYAKVDNADPDVVNEYNKAMKDTRIAMINNTIIDLRKTQVNPSRPNDPKS